MTNLPNRSEGPNWIENSEGEILPPDSEASPISYEFMDPERRARIEQTRRAELEELHPMNPTIAAIRNANALPSARTKSAQPNPLEGATKTYIEGRRKILG